MPAVLRRTSSSTDIASFWGSVQTTFILSCIVVGLILVRESVSSISYSFRPVGSSLPSGDSGEYEYEYEYEVAFPTAITPSDKAIFSGCRKFSIIHVGKAAGTTLGTWYDEVERGNQKHVTWHGSHSHRLGDIDDACYVFAVRDPISRWVSGFWSNARLGCPEHADRMIKKFRRNRKMGVMTKVEKSKAFFVFQTPNDLAEALSHPVRGKFARKAIQSIPHTRHNFEYYLPNLKAMVAAKRVPLVLSVTSLKEDIEKLEDLTGLSSGIDLSKRSHTNPCRKNSQRCHRSPSATLRSC